MKITFRATRPGEHPMQIGVNLTYRDCMIRGTLIFSVKFHLVNPSTQDLTSSDVLVVENSPLFR